MTHIELRGVSKVFRTDRHFSLIPRSGEKQNGKVVQALRDINLRIEDGSRVCILGPSGCGKSTLLRVIGGLVQQDEGEVLFYNRDMKNIIDRKIGMVFQDYALYPHMTGRDNILTHYIFRKNRWQYQQEAMDKFKRTSELMGVEIKHLLSRKPDTFSGGEKQRIAIARCITRDMNLFLLDEPFGALDQQLREQYRVKLKKLLNEFNVTTVFVTHDQHEAAIVGDVIVLMNKGCIVQVGTLSEIYQKPNCLFAAQFINPRQEATALNLLNGRIVGDEYIDTDCGFRAEDAEIVENGPISATLVDIRELPFSENRVAELEVHGVSCHVLFSGELPLGPGDDCTLRLGKVHVFSRKTGLRMETVELDMIAQ
ncbi:MAG: ABC transporter ATP-binding protein [Spirochaetales bacterium]|nr:ABC transporter ATP-binding protein [Spirochaetales bacterium]